MSDKQNTLKQLMALVETGDFDAFRRLYEACPFDIDHYRPMIGLDNRDVLTQTLLKNQPAIAAFMVDQIGFQNLQGIYASYNRNDGVCYVSPLYLAIENGMDDLALRIIAGGSVDLDDGKKLKIFVVEPGLGIAAPVWCNVEGVFDLAARLDNRKVIEALYAQAIARLTVKAQETEKNATFFPKTRAKAIRSKIAEFEEARDAILKPNGDAPPSPKRQPKPQ